jgi:hypothetical protein
MRVLRAVTLVAAAALLFGAVASAQSLADAAARERAKRKSKPTGVVKVITEEELRNSGGAVSNPGATGAESAPAAAGDAKPAAGDKATPEKAEEDAKAEQSAAWKARVETQRKEIALYQDLIKALQIDLDDTSGGVFTPRRASTQTRLEEAQRSLAASQQKMADLEIEGRKNGYR